MTFSTLGPSGAYQLSRSGGGAVRPLVDEAALVAVLRSDHFGDAAFDVAAVDPLRP